MDEPLEYAIRVEGHLAECWSEWFDGLVIHQEASGETTLCGKIPDQAALMGVLTKIQALNLALISVVRRSHLED